MKKAIFIISLLMNVCVYGQSVLRHYDYVCTYTKLSVNNSFKMIVDSIFSIIPKKKEFEKNVKSRQYYLDISTTYLNDSIISIYVFLDDFCPCLLDYTKEIEQYYCKLRGYNTIWWSKTPIPDWFTIGSKRVKLNFSREVYVDLVSGLEILETGEPWYTIDLEYNTFTNKVRIRLKDTPSFKIKKQ